MSSRSYLRTLAREFLLRQVFPRGLFKSRLISFTNVETETALIAMALWNRPAHFRTMLQNFASQDHPDGLVLGLWNNDARLHRFYLKEIQDWADSSPTGAVRRIHYSSSPINSGGAGRFYMGKSLVRKYRKPYIIFVDDDQVIGHAWLRELMSQSQRDTQKSWWAWHIRNDDYWDRVRARPGERVDYAATCGMIADAKVLFTPELFRDLPRDFWFMEDIWLNHVGMLHGQELFALDTRMEMVLDETNQYHALSTLKPEFFRQLRNS